MNPTDTHSLRNVAIIAHGGGGKTTLAETLLFNARAIDKRGTVEKGTVVMVTEPEEVERGITITTHVGRFTWREVQVNLIDTPGYIDFLEATRGALNVVGGAVMIFSGVSGVKPENERLWAMARQMVVPMIGFINKMDKPRANFINTLGEIERRFDVIALPVTVPIGGGESFQGIVDLIPMTAWSAKQGVFTQIAMPDSAREDALHYRTRLVEKLVELDDAWLESYLENGVEPTEVELHRALKEAVLTGRLLPVFCGSAQANIGVRALANGIISYLPGPTDKALIKPLAGVDPEHPERAMTRSPANEEPFSGVVFKTSIDPFAGKLSMVRVFSGILEGSQPFYNSTKRSKERGGHLFKLQGKEVLPVERLYTGEIGAVAKLDQTSTGDTICSITAPILYYRVKYQEPTVHFAVEVDAKTEDKVTQGLLKLTEEDPTLRLHRDEETQEILLSGMGQTHLTVALDRLKRKFGAVALLKTPRVAYRETIRRMVRVQGKLKKQSGGRGQFGDCWLELSPLPPGSGMVFEDRIVGGSVPRQFIPSVEKGVREAMASGVVGGYPVVDVAVALVDGSYHSVDSSDYAFKTAGTLGFKKGMEQAEPVLLEPIMAMEIAVPESTMGDVIGDLNSRRGKITGVIPKAGSQTIQAEAPMAELLDYGSILNAITSGRGLYTMSIAYYQDVPSHIARRVLEGRAAT